MEKNNNSVAIIKQSQIPISEIMSIGKAFVDSGMFPDIKSAAMAVVKIQAGQEIGIAPFAAMTGIHIIQGRPTIGAGLIASKIKSSGKYNYKIITHSKEICKIEFFEGKESLGESTFTIEDARKAGTKNLDKFPENMLFARAISNGVKWFCPDVFSGPVYTPEEMENIPQTTEDVQHEEIKTPIVDQNQEPKTEEAKRPVLPKEKPVPVPQSGDGKKEEKITPAVQGQKPWLNPNTKEWDNAFKKMHEGKINMDDVLANYRISKANHVNLLNPNYVYEPTNYEKFQTAK